MQPSPELSAGEQDSCIPHLCNLSYTPGTSTLEPVGIDEAKLSFAVGTLPLTGRLEQAISIFYRGNQSVNAPGSPMR